MVNQRISHLQSAPFVTFEPSLSFSEILVQAEYLSVDPYMRAYMVRYKPGVTMIGGQVARIIESKNPKFPVGAFMVGSYGWRSHTIVNPSTQEKGDMSYLLPPLGKIPVSLGVGALGMPGNTAYFGFLELCQPKAGETVVVTGAAGAVGSMVGQIAKIKGCRVIGFAGSDDKCEWLEKELGFDKAINYKKGDMRQALKEAAPKGVDCYFDNVGGELSSIIINEMNVFGRISVCGSISSYNTDPKDLPKVPILQPKVVFSQLRMEGFIVTRWADRWMEGITQNLKWIQEGKVKYHETVTEGFEQMPTAFIEMLRGANTGKAVVKANL